MVKLVLKTLSALGFLVNHDKSSLLPEQEKIFIGARINTQLGQMFLPATRVAVTHQNISMLLTLPTASGSVLVVDTGTSSCNNSYSIMGSVSSEVHCQLLIGLVVSSVTGLRCLDSCHVTDCSQAILVDGGECSVARGSPSEANSTCSYD